MENIIKSIDRDSPLRHHAHVGDALLAINGKRVVDVLDYKFYAYDTRLRVELRRPDGTEYAVTVRKPEGGDLGLDFESYLMDSPRSCANNCVFCFIDQLPPGMRKTMYFKDDDARLSFLLGNYITLTNLSRREIQRIIDLHVSPVNVSVHTMDPALRCRMLKNPRAGESIEIMRRFAENGIVMNCQTRFREGLEKLEPFTPEHAAETIDQITAFGDECAKKFGTRIFWCGDELYLEAGRELPPDEFYEEHTQLENGVGMLRLLETEFRSALKLSDAPDGVPFSIATGVAAAPFFEGLLALARERYPQLDGRVYAIENDFFGHSITVAGLITGQDLIRQLKGRELGRRLFISQNMLRREEMDFLDDVTLEDAVKALGLPIYPTEADGFALWDAISGDLLPEIRSPREGEVTEYYRYNQN